MIGNAVVSHIQQNICLAIIIWLPLLNMIVNLSQYFLAFLKILHYFLLSCDIANPQNYSVGEVLVHIIFFDTNIFKIAY